MPPVINAYSYRTEITELGDAIATRWDEGYDLVNVEYGEGAWFSLFGEDIGRGAYAQSRSFSNLLQDISDYWDQGYELIDMGYGDGRWFAVFNDISSFTSNGYSYSSTLTDFTQAISERWDDGFRLVDVEYGDGTWFGVFNQTYSVNAYSYNGELTDFTQSVANRWEEGYELIDVEYGDGTWFGVFGPNQAGRNGYAYRSSLEEFEDAIADWWDDGFELVDTAYGDGTWFGVFQEMPEDAYEYNDTLESAYDLSREERTWLSTISGLGQQYDDDWYEIDVTPGYENVVAQIEFTHAEGDIDLALYDANGTFITSSISTTDNESIDTIVPNPGTYYLRVYYDDAGNTYDLWWDDLFNTTAPPNSLPVAVDDAFTITADGALFTVDVLANDIDDDGDPLRITQINGRAIATNSSITLGSGAVLTVNRDGTLDYDASSLLTNSSEPKITDSFSYAVSDGNGGTDTASVNLTVVQPTQPPPPASGFNIQVRFIDDSLTPSQQAAFTTAANRWSDIIIEDVPDVFVTGFGLVDDVVIDASASAIDGPSGTLGYARPTRFRQDSRLPFFGEMTFDSEDIAVMEAEGSFVDVIVHEMGHVLGIGTIWDNLDLLDVSNPGDPRFTGVLATAEYNKLFDVNESSVPVEAEGGPGTALSHWRESVFDNELMTGYLNVGINPLSRITVASLADLGYTVDMAAADVFVPTHDSLIG
ncbi:MAG: leishmanolysin-related zinc metalloendopeptidase [Cyanobacteria bacterium P01_F01_bin.150]